MRHVVSVQAPHYADRCLVRVPFGRGCSSPTTPPHHPLRISAHTINTNDYRAASRFNVQASTHTASLSALTTHTRNGWRQGYEICASSGDKPVSNITQAKQEARLVARQAATAQASRRSRTRRRPVSKYVAVLRHAQGSKHLQRWARRIPHSATQRIGFSCNIGSRDAQCSRTRHAANISKQTSRFAY